MCDNHLRCVPEDAPRHLGAGAQIYVSHEAYGEGAAELYEQNGFYGTIVDRWVEIFTDSCPGQDDKTLAEYVYLLRAPGDNEEHVVRERWLS
jgi:hypothetical protein